MKGSKSVAVNGLNQILCRDLAAQAVTGNFALEVAHSLSSASELKAQILAPQTGTQQLQGAAI
jgi:putative effector of murein hydrolase